MAANLCFLLCHYIKALFSQGREASLLALGDPWKALGEDFLMLASNLHVKLMLHVKKNKVQGDGLPCPYVLL